MDVRVLRNFLSVTEHRSIGRAAEAVHMTQPALSKSIQRLEQELGVRLFDRHGTGTEPTAFGRALVEHAGTVLQDMRRLGELMADMRDGRAGHVTIGAGAGVLETLVSRATASLCVRHPGVRVTAVAGLAEELLPMLQRGELDLVVGSRPAAFVDEAISWRLFFSDTTGIIVRKGHPLLRRRELTLKDITQCSWILPSVEHTFTKGCAACFAAAGLLAPVPSVVASSVTFIDSVVLNTDYLTFMPLPLVQGTFRREGMTQLKVRGGTWAREVFLFTRHSASHSPAAAALVGEMEVLIAAEKDGGSRKNKRLST